MAEIHHLENQRDVIFLLWWSDLDKILQTTAEWHVDCSDVVEIETGARILRPNFLPGSSYPGTVGRGYGASYKNTPHRRRHYGLIEVHTDNHVLLFQGRHIQTDVRCRYGMWSPVSPLLANLFTEWLEKQAIATGWMQTKILEAVCGRCFGTDKAESGEESYGPHQHHWSHWQHQVHLRIKGGQADPIIGHSPSPMGRSVSETSGL